MVSVGVPFRCAPPSLTFQNGTMVWLGQDKQLFFREGLLNGCGGAVGRGRPWPSAGRGRPWGPSAGRGDRGSLAGRGGCRRAVAAVGHRRAVAILAGSWRAVVLAVLAVVASRGGRGSWPCG